MSPPAGSSLWREVCGPGVVIDGQPIPVGCDVGTCIYSIHHNAAYYPDPFLYRPERWLKSTTDGITDEKAAGVQLAQSAFNPFSIGARSCIGKGLANAELMLAMATLLTRFDFRVADGEAGYIGEGLEGAEFGRHRKGEYQLYDHVTAGKNGPMVQFRTIVT